MTPPSHQKKRNRNTEVAVTSQRIIIFQDTVMSAKFEIISRSNQVVEWLGRDCEAGTLRDLDAIQTSESYSMFLS